MIIAIFIASMLVGIVIRLPTAIALLLCAVAAAPAPGDGDVNPMIIMCTLIQGSDPATMTVLPFFVLAGEIMNRGGPTKRIIAFCNIFIGCVCGGLGHATILVYLTFASLVGSTVVACAALDAILISMMANPDCSREKAAALTASVNLVTPIMPPSVSMTVYGIAVGVSTKFLFMDDIASAVYLAIIASVVWLFVSRKKGVVSDMETVSKPTPERVVKVILAGLQALLLPVIILVGLCFGYLTATETGVVACVYVILIGLLVCHEMKIKDLMKAFVASAEISAVVMFLAAIANCVAYFMTISRIPQMMTSGLEDLVERPTLLMFVLMCTVVVVGLAMDVVPSVLILTPIMLPLVKAAGIDLVYFRIVSILMNVLDPTSPPVEPVLNVACATGKMKMDKIILSTIPYFTAQTILCFLLAFVPVLVGVPLR